MNEWLKRMRGAIGMGLTWAVGWTAIGALLSLVLFVVGMDPPGFFATITAIFGAAGFLSGNMFSAVLLLTEGQRRFDELSLPRFVAWGAVGGLLLGGLGITFFGGPGLQAFETVVAGVTTFLGAGSAAATLALARRAEGGKKSINAASDAAQAGLAEASTPRQLGDADPS